MRLLMFSFIILLLSGSAFSLGPRAVTMPGTGEGPADHEAGLDVAEILAHEVVTDNLGIADAELIHAGYDEPIYGNGSGIFVTSYQQQYHGLPIHGTVTAIAVQGGDVVSMRSEQYSDADVDLQPAISADDAFAGALMAVKKAPMVIRGFTGISSEARLRRQDIQNLEPDNISLSIYPEDNGSLHLAWKVEFPLLRNPPSQWHVFVDAHTGGILNMENRVRHELTGQVTGPVYPKSPARGNATLAFMNLNITLLQDGGILASGITDSTGRYSIPGSGNATVYARHEGPYVRVVNLAQNESEHNVSKELPASYSWDWTGYDTSYKFEESNAYYHANIAHDFFTGGSPFDISGLDSQKYVYVQESGTCNAYADGYGDIHFYPAGGGCEATSLSSDVIYHEYTHTVHDLVNPTLSPYWGEPGGMMEGWADYFAASINDDPCMSEDVFYSLSCLRYLNNSKRYPDDYADGEPHGTGEIFGPALWDLRTFLGRNLTDELVIRAMKLLGGTWSEYIHDLMVVDDDNADVNDGTPHINEICVSFYDGHGILSNDCLNYTNVSVARINDPAAGSRFSADYLTVNGTIYPPMDSVLDTALTEYSVDGVIWIRINSSNTAAIDATLTGWNISFVADDDYLVRLTVNDTNGSTASSTVNISIDKVYFTDPPRNSFYRTGSNITFAGYANATNFQNFWLEYGSGAAPSSWSRDGVSLTNNGAAPARGALGVWNTANVSAHDYYTIRLMVNQSAIVNNHTVTVVLDPDYLPGWPQRINGRLIAATVAVGDIDNDGGLEIAAGESNMSSSAGQNFYVWHSNGSMYSGWPVPGAGEYAIRSSPAMADVDSDSDLEIFVGTDLYRVYAWHHNGTAQAGWPAADPWDDVLGGITLGDLDGDGDLEIIAADIDDGLYAWHRNGSMLGGFPVYQGSSYVSTPAVADLDDDGLPEIIIGNTNGFLYAITATGKNLSGWPVDLGSSIWSSPAIADLDGDYDYEVAVASWAQFHLLHHNGSPVSGWPVQANGSYSSPALADLNNDSYLDILFASIAGVYAYHLNGSLLPGWPVPATAAFTNSPIVGDIDGDGDPEVLINSDCTNDRLYAWHHDGSNVSGWPKIVPTPQLEYYHYSKLSNPVIADIDSDNDTDIVLGDEGYLFVWDLNAAYDAGNVPWGVFHANQHHTGLYSVPGPVPGISSMECNNGTSWLDCSAISYNQTIARMRANCTGASAARFRLENLDDGATLINGIAALQNGSMVLDNGDIPLRDSGDWRLYATCYGNNSQKTTRSVSWSLPWGKLASYSVTGNLTAPLNGFFNYTSGVRCLYGECGNISAYLNPRDRVSLFYDGFESAAIQDHWVTYNSNPYGRIRASNLSGPYNGSYHLIMDVNQSAQYALTELVTGLALDGHDDLELSFQMKSIGDEDHACPLSWSGHANGDCVAVTCDGANWVMVRNLTASGGTSNAYQEFIIDISNGTLSACGTVNASFGIKFQHYDNYPISSDGFAFDDIRLTALSDLVYDVPVHSGSPLYTIDQNPRDHLNLSCLGNMLAGDNCNQTWTINATGNGTYAFFVRYSSNYAGVLANDSPQASITIANASVSIILQLGAGWNLISVPVRAGNASSRALLAPIPGFDKAWMYNASDGNPWKLYDPNSPFPFLNTLAGISTDYGYWISVTSPSSLNLTGSVVNALNVSLVAGWNLVGYPFTSGRPASSAFSGLSGFDKAYQYNASGWHLYDPDSPFPFLNTLANLDPGSGYWLRVSGSDRWVLN
ncbi:MAG: FG-GAP-like repeat-containing protein [archaeon]